MMMNSYVYRKFALWIMMVSELNLCFKVFVFYPLSMQNHNVCVGFNQTMYTVMESAVQWRCVLI